MRHSGVYRGFYQHAQVKPFNQEAFCDHFAELDPVDPVRHQGSVTRRLCNL